MEREYQRIRQSRLLSPGARSSVVFYAITYYSSESHLKTSTSGPDCPNSIGRLITGLNCWQT